MQGWRYTNDEVEFLAEMYQKIADARRIRWVNERDARHDSRLLVFTAIAVLLFFLMWFV